MIIPVVLSGGSGTRLWPLSTPEKPKQFLPLITDKTLFQETLLRLEGLPRVVDPIVVCNDAHRFLVAEQLREIGMSAQAIVLEPAGRNTAPAIAVAAMLAQGSDFFSAPAEKGSDPILLVLPADHVIADGAQFRAAVARAVKAAEGGRLVTFGIVPTSAETGYGYIEQGSGEGEWWVVERFVEKPDRKTAESYLASGRFLWNSGMFVFGAGRLLEELERCAPKIISVCKAAVSGAVADDDFIWLGPEFLECLADSIDYAVMEKTSRAAVVPLDVGWSDVGSWAALHNALPKDQDGNVLRGNVRADSCRDSYIQSTGRAVAVIGIDGAVIVQTDSAVLVTSHDHAQRVKNAAASFRETNAADE